MTREGIFKLAREAGATPYTNRHYPDRTVHTFGPEQLERFTSDLAKHCAKICDDLPAPESCTGIESSLWDVATLACGDAIRAGVQS